MTQHGTRVTRCLPAIISSIMVLSFASAHAQTSDWTGTGFVTIGGGTQSSNQAFKSTKSVMKYGELAKFETDYSSRNGAILDVSAGIRVWQKLAFSVGVSLFESQDNISGQGTVPNPLFIGRPRTVTFEGASFQHRQLGIHLSLVYVIPLSDRIRVTVFGGPTLFRLNQDVVEDLQLGPETDAPFFNTVDVQSALATSVTQAGIGGHFGFDGTYLMTSQFGVTGIFRFAGGSVELLDGNSTIPVDVGGPQLSGGLRLFF